MQCKRFQQNRRVSPTCAYPSRDPPQGSLFLAPLRRVAACVMGSELPFARFLLEVTVYHYTDSHCFLMIAW